MASLLICCLLHVFVQDAPISVTVDRVFLGKSSFVVVNVGNRSTVPLTEVNINLYGVPKAATVNLADLMPSQQKAAMVPVGTTNTSVVVVVSFKLNATKMSVARVIAASEVRPGFSWSALVPTIMTLIGALAGVGMGHALSTKRERVNQERAARSARMAASTTALNAFITNWNASVLANVLETQYAVLAKTVLLPPSAVLAYRRTLDVLRDAGADSISKQAAASAFAERIRGLTTNDSEWT